MNQIIQTCEHILTPTSSPEQFFKNSKTRLPVIMKGCAGDEVDSYTHVADLKTLWTKQMKHLMTNYSHHYVIEKLIFYFFFLRKFVPTKCKKGSNSLDLIPTKSKTYADCKNMYPLNEIRVDAATHKLLLSRKYQNARFMVQAKALNFTKKLKLTPSLSPPPLSLSLLFSLFQESDR